MLKFHEKYSHIGFSWADNAPKGWQPIVEKALIDIEKIMWPQWWLPMWLKRFIHYTACKNSVVQINNRLFYKLRDKLTHGQMVRDIKEKFAGLRIYGDFGPLINKVVKDAVKQCDGTCQQCGSTQDVKNFKRVGWWVNLCVDCRNKK